VISKHYRLTDMNALAPVPGNGRLLIIRPMKIYVAALAFPGTLAVSAPHGTLPAASKVMVCVQKAPAVEEEVLDRGEMSAGKILALVGLEIEWRNQRRSCPPEQDPIILKVTTNTPKDYFPRAYGTALPFEGTHISVFYDRIQRIRPDQVVPLLGHVLAHEIVHVLSGTDVHSETGVMKRRWSQSDLEEMVIRPLPFSSLDILLLNFGIRDRHARIATIRNQNTVSTATLPSE
jgi:hypothetical protein